MMSFLFLVHVPALVLFFFFVFVFVFCFVLFCLCTSYDKFCNDQWLTFLRFFDLSYHVRHRIEFISVFDWGNLGYQLLLFHHQWTL